MAKLLLGKEVSDALAEQLKQRADALKAQGIRPALAIIRLGENPGDLSYEKGAIKRAESLGIAVRTIVLSEQSSAEEVMQALDAVNEDASVHGVLLFRPLPKHLKDREQEICNRLSPQKDVDGMTDLSAAGVYTGQKLGFPPCTAAACMEILNHYGVDIAGKKAVVLGRSLVIGRPVAMMLLAGSATVSILHSRTRDAASHIENADILVCAAGEKKLVKADMVRPHQIILDVSMNWDPEKITVRGKGGMVGDCDFENAEPIVSAITPVPGGVGAVTNTVLMKHVIQAAENQNRT